MGSPNENPARAGGGASEKTDLADEADRAQSNPEWSELQAHRLGVTADPFVLAEQELACIQLDWGQPSQRELDWLRHKGVTWEALITPWPIGATKVLFAGSTFKPDPNGVRAITFAVIDRLNVVDIAAWQPRTGELASWRGQAFCLGDLDDLFNPAIYFAARALPIHASPLEWLRASRDGIVIMRPELTYSYLRNVQRLAFSDAALAGLVRTRLRPPRPRVDLLIEVPADDRRAV